MKRILGTVIVGAFLVSPVVAQELPPADAKAGECYAKVLIPPKYETTTERVMVHAGGTEYRKIPAKYETVEQRVLVQEESYELIAIPPTFEMVTETVMVQPEEVVKTVIPATYRSEKKDVLVSPARVEWKPGRGAYEKIDAATGEIMCRVEIPAQYKTVETTVIATEAKATEQVIPAKFATIQRRVMKTEPTTQRKVIPAKYETIQIKKLIEAEKFEAVKTPPRYEDVERRKLVSSESVQWREILCETNTTPRTVLRIQQKLVEKGYSLGTQPNGNFGPATRAAIRQYQIDNGLPTGGLTISTIKALGVSVSG